MTPSRPQFLFIFLVLLLAAVSGWWVYATSESKRFQVNVIPKQFGDYRYQMMWIRSQASNLSLGINMGDFKDSNFGTRVHDYKTGPGEFSCYPDDVCFFKSETGQWQGAYAGYMQWEKTVQVKNFTATITYHRKSEKDMLTRYIEPEILATMTAPPLDLSVTHSLVSGQPYVLTQIEATNSGSDSVDFRWAYQDGVFLWLPHQHQLDVLPYSSEDGISYGTVGQPSHGWVAQVNFEKQIASILYSADAKLLYTRNKHLALRGVGDLFSEDNNNPYFPLGGNDRYQIKIEKDPLEILESIEPTKPRSDEFKTMGAFLDFGRIQPNEAVTRKFYRFGVYFQNETELVQSVESVIRQIKKP